MSKEKVDWFKQPDWDYIKEKYPNDYEAIKSYWGGRTWSIIDCRPFTEEEMGMIKCCTVIPSSFGKSMAFELTDGRLFYVPLERDYDPELGHEPSPMELYILTLVKKCCLEDGSIYRITDTPVNIQRELEDVQAECCRLQQIIMSEDTFRGCLKLY